MKLTSFLTALCAFGVNAAPAINFKFDVTGYTVTDYCTGETATVVSGQEHIVITQTCHASDAGTRCHFVNNFSVSNVKLVWPDGTTAGFSISGHDNGDFTYDPSTFTSQTTESHFTHSVTVTRGSTQNEVVTMDQKCTFTFGPGGVNIDCEAPKLNIDKCSGTSA